MRTERILTNLTGELAVFKNDKTEDVFMKESFPWSSPGKFLSFRNSDDKEVLFINGHEELCFCERIHVDKHLKRLKFTLEIEEIFSIEEEYELRKFVVRTSQGERVFYTKIDDWPEIKMDGSVVITDVSKDIYRIKSLGQLDQSSRKKISYYVD